MLAGSKRIWGIIGVITVIFLIFTLRPLAVMPPAINTSDAFDVDRAFTRLVRILGDEAPHPVDSAANDQVRERLLTEIRGLGFEPIVRDDFHCRTRATTVVCARVRNVMFWVTAAGPDAVAITSHYDSVPPGPGAADDGAGVAASLEIAHLLRGRDLMRPVLVLITDGEEGGLIGASSFVENDPLADQVGAVVNMEARGNRGLVSFFQTSRPNGRDLAGLGSSTRLPAANSLNADIYDLLPNDTDMTVFLPMGIDAANFAFLDGPQFYHTPSDNLANLDRRSLNQIGISALAAVEAFLEQDSSEPEGEYIYTDILGTWMLVLPQSWGLVLIVLGGIAALGSFITQRTGGALRAAIAPPLALVMGLGLAIGITMIVGMIRPEMNFGSAHPWALRSVHNLAALLGVAFVFALLARPGMNFRLVTSGWFWLAIAGGAATYYVPGAAILFAPSLFVFTIAVVLLWFGLKLAAQITAMAAAVLFAAIVVPLTAGGETGLLIENAAPFAFGALFLALLVVPLILPSDDSSKTVPWSVPGLVCLSLAGFFVAALLVPAYSPAAPQSLSIVHVLQSADSEPLWAIRDREPLPPEMATEFDFAPEVLPALPGTWVSTPAAPLPNAGVETEISRDQTNGDVRDITLRIRASDADRMWIRIENPAALQSLKLGNENISSENGPIDTLICYGRSCRELELAIQLSANELSTNELSTNELPTNEPAPTLILISLKHGLGPESERLLATRPDWALPQHWGDLRVVIARVPL